MGGAGTAGVQDRAAQRRHVLCAQEGKAEGTGRGVAEEWPWGGPLGMHSALVMVLSLLPGARF